MGTLGEKDVGEVEDILRLIRVAGENPTLSLHLWVYVCVCVCVCACMHVCVCVCV